MSEVRITQVVAEVMVPFTEGNTTQSGVRTTRFDAGEGSVYYLVSPVVDSGVELRSKTIKSVRQTGRRTNVSAMIYGYDVDDSISVNDLEAGVNSSTGPIALDDSTDVAQSEREPCNVVNSVLWAVRLEGDDTGQAERDRIDEIVVEVAEQGVRR